ncbi:MAG: hypothetical protein KY439_04240 [Actinobacteria bacterium]|nr:hypothetical protein [Actinomycetota bacterium]
MGTQRTSFAKLQRDQAKKAKADAKRARRQDRGSEPGEPGEGVVDLAGDNSGPVSAADLLQLVETLHQRFESGAVTYEEFEETKAELLSRLPID